MLKLIKQMIFLRYLKDGVLVKKQPLFVAKKLVFTTLVLILFMLNGCSGSGQYAPVVERVERVSSVPEKHKVNTGETLYSIAWRYRLEASELARTNGIRSPYTIFPGQLLLLRRQEPLSVKNSKALAEPLSNARSKSSEKLSKNTPISSREPAKNEHQVTKKSGYPFRWQWPAKGKTMRGFSSSSGVHKGIDIQGVLGESVRAANSGEVVYAGNGLVGYGELLIVKHNDHYLSAYGHNRKLLVKEGDIVKVGQRIAEMGDTGTDKVKLHFEIRRDGKPINPIKLLPKK